MLSERSPHVLDRKAQGKPNMQSRMQQRDMTLHKVNFKPHGLSDGTKTTYYVKGQQLLEGYKLESGKCCRCCNTEGSCSHPETHAGLSSRRNPYNNIYLPDGQSLHEVTLSLASQRSFKTKYVIRMMIFMQNVVMEGICFFVKFFQGLSTQILLKSNIFCISSSDLVSKWMGESEKLVANLFQMARDSAPSIIFIDEIDSLCGTRGESNESEASRRIKTELLVQMQGVGNNDDKVLVLAATNTPYALDQAIRRRFDKRIYIPLPEVKARQHMFKVHLGDTPQNLTESDFEELACRTEGFSGSDIAVCVKDVLFEPVRKTQDAMFFRKVSTEEGEMWMPCGPRQAGAVQTTMQELAAEGLAAKILPPPITKADFDKVIARQRPTVSKSDLEVHERFTKEFGEDG